jgi:glutamate-1-semialdehyde 2,1-aminomutase
MINNFEKSNILRKKAAKLIPGGAHTYSKGDDQFPALSPHSIVKGKGARIWDVDGNEFVDWGMGLTSVILGHAYKPVVEAVKKELDNGCNFIRPSYIEAEVAELMVNQISSAEMVKFAKNGSDATTAAIRLARAYTKKNIVLRCGDNPFFSVHDWFIGDTPVDNGVLKCVKNYTKRFKYNDIDDLKNQIEKYRDEGIACVIMEPASTQEPKEGYLQKVREICTKEGIVLIFDEVVSGFRFHPKGAQYLYKVIPDLATFGKAMANGFSISALVGKREIMELGGLEHNKERVFLLSTTFGGETHHLRAAQKCIETLNQNDYEVTKHIWDVGRIIKDNFNKIAKSFGIDKYAKCEGIDCRPYFVFLDKEGKADNVLRTLFVQEMIKYGVLLQSVNPSFSHRDSEINQTIEGFEKALKTLSYAIENNKIRELLVGEPVKPVFRRYN